MGPFHERQKKNMILRDSKRSSFITDFFELQCDTATMIIPSFRMMKHNLMPLKTEQFCHIFF